MFCFFSCSMVCRIDTKLGDPQYCEHVEKPSDGIGSDQFTLQMQSRKASQNANVNVDHV